jgi:hypothetical protein
MLRAEPKKAKLQMPVGYRHNNLPVSAISQPARG